MPSIVLTFAELEFLLGDRPAARDRLQLADGDGDVSASGLSSLMARGLAVAAGDVAVPAQELIPLLDALGEPSAWVEIGFAGEENAGGVQVFESPSGRFTATAGAFGLYEFYELDPAESLPKVAGALVAELLGSAEPCAAFVRADAAGDNGFALRRLPTGEIEVSTSAEGSADVRGTSLKDAMANLELYVATNTRLAVRDD